MLHAAGVSGMDASVHVGFCYCSVARATHNHVIDPLWNYIIIFDEHKKSRMYVLHYPDDFK